MERIYYYSWGNEDLLGASIEIIKDSYEHYTIKFEQDASTIEHFVDVKINGTIIGRMTQDKNTDHGINRKMVINFKAILNPAPEKLFELIE